VRGFGQTGARRVGRAGAALTLAAALVTGPALSAAADRPVPGQDEVRRARERTGLAAGRVERIEAEVQRSRHRVEAADIAMSQAAEDYDYALVRLRTARRDAQAAQAVAEQAARHLDTAQDQVGALAAQAYRTGGNLAQLDLLLSRKGPQEVLERASMMQVLAGRRQRAVQRADTARVLANTLRSKAAAAVQRRAAAAGDLAEAQRTARARAAAAEQALAADTRRRTRLIAELARARRTSMAIEQARAEALAVREHRRREAAAEREAVRRAAPDRSEGDGGAVDRERSGGPEGANPGGRDPGGQGSEGGGTGGSGDSAGSDGSDGSGRSRGTGRSEGSGGSDVARSAGAAAVTWARRRLGLPYRWGGEGPASYDCSGLVMKAWAQAGVALPHSSRLQYASVTHVAPGSVRPGDLLFFGSDSGNPQSIHHVAMYVGSGRMIEAPYTGAVIRIVPVRSSGAMPYAGRP